MSELPGRVVKMREFAAKATEIALPTRLVDTWGGIEYTQQMLREGRGIVALSNHFDMWDVSAVIREFFRGDESSKRPIVIPTAIHQFHSSMRVPGRMLGVKHSVIVTEHSKTKGQYEKREEAQRLIAYEQEAQATIREGGIIVMAPQGERQPQLNSVTAATSFLLGRLAKRQNTHLGIAFFGVGLEGADNYDLKKHGKFNLGKPHTIQVGDSLTFESALEEMGGDLRQADTWVMEKLAQIVPKPYLPPEVHHNHE